VSFDFNDVLNIILTGAWYTIGGVLVIVALRKFLPGTI